MSDAKRKVPDPDPDCPEVSHPPLPPTTTSEQNLKTAGQRQINRVWEYTQALIAVSVIETTLIVAAVLVIKGAISDKEETASVTAMVLLASLANLVIGFYFGRTNHARLGDEPSQPKS